MNYLKHFHLIIQRNMQLMMWKQRQQRQGVKVTNLTPGTHTLTISDANGKYAPVSATFTATTDTVMASYDEYEGKTGCCGRYYR